MTMRFYIDRSDEDLIISDYNGYSVISSVSYEHWQDPVNQDLKCVPYECYLIGEKGTISDHMRWTRNGKYTRKIPLFVKNVHREVYGLPPLKEEKVVPEWFLDYRDGTVHCPTEDYVDELSASVKEWMLQNKGKRCHWMGNREMFKTWTFTCPTETLIKDLVPLLDGTPYFAVLKSW